LDFDIETTDNLDELSHALLAVWPNEHDLDLILSIPVGLSVLYHGIVCMPYPKFLGAQIPSPRKMLQLPVPGSHPVLIARRLLLLGTFLQGIPPSYAKKLAQLSTPYKNLMCLLVKTASRLVTNNDELVGSLDGIECVMIESMYLNNAGNLRRAWLKNRKAMVLAQMMGLHKETGMPITVLETGTRERVDPGHMWLRLVLSDRYLSLILGLPQGSLENTFASPEALSHCTPMEKMERIEGLVSNLILQRNEGDRTDLAATHKMDRMLQEAAALMPPQWWLSNPVAAPGADVDAFKESIRLVLHFTHYHLLVQVHLPYMLQPSSVNPGYDYSKMSGASAARAILTLFVSFHRSESGTTYCRGIDFVAFIASVTLCLAHVESRRPLKTSGVTAFQSLQHQRLGDRALLERTLEVMETMAKDDSDIVAQRISSILRPLLAIEHDSAMGNYYHATTSPDAGGPNPQWLSSKQRGLGELSIQIPYFGTIKIEHRPDAKETAEPMQISADGSLRDTSSLADNSAGLVVLREAKSPVLNESLDSGQQGEATFEARRLGYEISTTHPANPDWQAVPSYFDQLGSIQQDGFPNWDQVAISSEARGSQPVHLLVPGLTTDVEDWALQGVDAALFSSLTHG
jgi:hypothetical protein